jgi:cytochrome P450 family 9
MFEFKHPVYFIRDPEIIKKLTIKEFENFTDHRLVIDEEVEPLFAKGLFGLTGQKWKGMSSFEMVFIRKLKNL